MNGPFIAAPLGASRGYAAQGMNGPLITARLDTSRGARHERTIHHHTTGHLARAEAMNGPFISARADTSLGKRWGKR